MFGAVGMKKKKGNNPSTKTAYPTDESVSMRLEQIENGHLRHVTHSGTDKKGNYFGKTKTFFHRKAPKHFMGIAKRSMGAD
jgi:hypothetical protein